MEVDLFSLPKVKVRKASTGLGVPTHSIHRTSQLKRSLVIGVSGRVSTHLLNREGIGRDLTRQVDATIELGPNC